MPGFDVIKLAKVLFLAALALALISAISGFFTAGQLGSQGLQRLTGTVELPRAQGVITAQAAFDALKDAPVGSGVFTSMLYYLKVFVAFCVSIGSISLMWRLYQFFNQAS